MPARKLAVVTDDTPKTPKKQPTLTQAIELTERDVLVAMRSQLAKTLAAGPPDHTIAQLMTKLREVDKDIRAIDHQAAEERGDANQGPPGDQAFDPSTV